MQTVQNNGTGYDISSLAPEKKASASETEEAQNRFLTLLVTQLKNQDPLNPMDNAQVTTQLAQISTVEGIAKLNTTLQSLVGSYAATQSLQATSMLGHAVLVSGSTLQLANGVAVGGVSLESPADKVVVTVTDKAGNVRQQVDLGAHPAGVVEFAWDGANSQGGKSPDGQYTVSVTASRGDQKVNAAPLSYGVVTAVSPSASGTTVTVGELGTVPYTDVKQVLQ